jgi:hypothetical protein
MPAYADISFLVRVYTPPADSQKALSWLQRAREPLPFTSLHRHAVGGYRCSGVTFLQMAADCALNTTPDVPILKPWN